MIRRAAPLLLVAGTLVAAGLAVPASAAPPGSPVVLHSGQVTRQDVPSRAGSETDTVVEPDVAVNPADSANAIAVAHDSRYRDGGAVSISAAWTKDGGATWSHQPVRRITKALGGPYDRASDPVVAYSADGTAYLSVLLLDVNDCNTAVAVLVSKDEGATWSAPHYAHRSSVCTYSDDKNWIVVDTYRTSPHFGRVYQFWTPFRYTTHNFYISAPQAVRYSDDEGVTWSATYYVNGIDHGSQNSQPMIMSDGTVVDTFYDFGVGGAVPDAVPGGSPEQARASAVTPSSIDASGTIYAAYSHNGGRTWSHEVEVANNAGGYSPGVRCCLFAADIDRASQTMYVAYEGGVGNTDPVYVSWSRDGVSWSSPAKVTKGDVPGVTRVNVDVVARAGTVYVAYGTRTDPGNEGGFVQQQLSTSTNGGLSFGAPMSLGPRSALQYAARAGGYFPGDYIGAAIAPDRLYLVWARSSKPPAYSTSKFHQVIWGATLTP